MKKIISLYNTNNTNNGHQYPFFYKNKNILYLLTIQYRIYTHKIL